MSPKIKYVFFTTKSKKDKSGNVYVYTDMICTQTGAIVRFKSEDDVALTIRCQLNLKFDEVVRSTRVISKKEFKKKVEKLTYGNANDFITSMNDMRRGMEMHKKPLFGGCYIHSH